MPRSAATWLAKSTSACAWRTRSPLNAPWMPLALSPVAGGVLSPFDLKWLTTTRKPSESRAPLRLNSWASGSRALANGSPGSDWSDSTTDEPTGSTFAGL